METVDLDNPTQEDIETLINKVKKCTEVFAQNKENIVDYFKLCLSEQKHLYDIRKQIEIWKNLKDMVEDAGKYMTLSFATILYMQFYYTGEEHYKKAAFEIFPKEDMEKLIDDKPDLELIK